MHPAVRVEDLGKCYRIDETQPRGGYHSLREDLMRWSERRCGASAGRRDQRRAGLLGLKGRRL